MIAETAPGLSSLRRNNKSHPQNQSKRYFLTPLLPKVFRWRDRILFRRQRRFFFVVQ